MMLSGSILYVNVFTRLLCVLMRTDLLTFSATQIKKINRSQFIKPLGLA